MQANLADWPATIKPWTFSDTSPPYLVPNSMRWFAMRICEREGFSLAEFRGPSRYRKHAWARQEMMALAYDTGRFSLPQIGRWLGGRDHTTIHYGIRRHWARVEAERQRQLPLRLLALPAPEERSRPGAEPHTELA